MTSYEDYLASVETLGTAIVAADHAQARAQRAAAAALEKCELEHKRMRQDVQEQAIRAARDYGRAARGLQLPAASGVGLQLPERVRPTPSPVPAKQAQADQDKAQTGLERALAEYTSVVAREAGSANAAAEALAARRAALSRPPEQAVETPEPPPEPPAVVVPARPSWFQRLLAAVRGVFVRDSPTQKPRAAPKPVRPSGQVLERATRPGTVTGFEPRDLDGVELVRSPLMHGNPGVGLGDSGFDATAVRLGQKGEVNFAKALAKTGLLSRFATFWSIHMLAKDTYGTEAADVDCAIITGHTIWLVDVKYYAGGDVVYRAEGDRRLVCYDGATGQQVGKTKTMSKNMQMAVDRFRSRYQNYKTFRLEARVVFVPTNSGSGRIEGVQWPGGVPAVTLADFLAELRAEPSFVETLDSDLVRRTFTGLLK